MTSSSSATGAPLSPPATVRFWVCARALWLQWYHLVVAGAWLSQQQVQDGLQGGFHSLQQCCAFDWLDILSKIGVPCPAASSKCSAHQPSLPENAVCAPTPIGWLRMPLGHALREAKSL